MPSQPPADANPAPPRSLPMETLFHEIVNEARQIDLMLNGVTDKESADRSVRLLEQMLTHMDEHLHELEHFPFRQEQEAELLKSHMATLTHISQSYLSAMQRLAEVNAYGSEPLLALFVRYKVGSEKIKLLQAEDMPHTLLYGELADTLEDAIYTLNRVQNAAGSATVLPRLRALLGTANRVHHMLAQLVPPATDEQKEAVRPAREKLQKLFNDLKKAVDRLQNDRSYGNAELDALLPQLLQMGLG